MTLDSEKKSVRLKSSEIKTYGALKINAGVETNKTISIFKLLQYFKWYDKIILLVGLIGAVLHGGVSPLLAVIFGGMTDTLLNYGNNQSTNASLLEKDELESSDADGNLLNSIRTFSYAYIYLAIAVFIFTTIQALCWEITCERLIYGLRCKFLNQTLRQSVSWHETEKTGDLVSQLNDDLERVREGIGHKFSIIFQYLSTIIFGFLVGFYASWKLSLVILAVTPILGVATSVSAMVSAKSSSREQDRYGNAGHKAQQILCSIRTVAAFTGEFKEIEKYKYELQEAFSSARKKFKWLSVAYASVYFFIYSSYALVLYYGATLLSYGELTPGNIFTVLLSALSSAFAIGNMLPFISTLGLAKGSIQRPLKIIESTPSIDPSSKPGLKPTNIVRRIEFQNVNFFYPSRPDSKVLNDFNLQIEPGEKIAIVGPSGSGKSTLANLLLRFYEPTQGKIRIDGIDLAHINLHYLRESMIGLVSQDIVLFETTIEENIRVGGVGPIISFGQIQTAAKLANAHDFISALPEGYNTTVGHSGLQLSGGQRQRISIARAIISNPKILILDEATSALDVNSEKVVQEALGNVMKGRTNIIIAHRLNTIRDADKIYYLKEGRVVESGSHKELMSRRGLYYDQAITQELDQEKSQQQLEGSGELIKTSTGSAEKSISIRKKSFAKVFEISTDYESELPGTWDIVLKMRPEWGVLSLGLLGCIIVGVIYPIFSFMYGNMISVLSLPTNLMLEKSKMWAALFVVIAIISAIGMWIRNFIGISAERLALRLRVEFFTSIIRQSVGWYDDEAHTPGVLLTRLSADVGNIKGAASHRIAVLSTAIVTILLSFIIAYVTSWQLALVLSISFPIIIAASYFESKITKRTASGERFLKEEAGRLAAEGISNIRTIQGIGKEIYFYRKYQQCLEYVLKEQLKKAIGYSVLIGFSESIMYFTYALAFTVGAYWIDIGILDVSQVYIVFFTVTICAVSVGQIMALATDYTAGREAVKNIYEMINIQSTIDPLSPNGSKPQIVGNISFENVYFAYPQRSSVPVLRGLNFQAEAGKILAIVGTSGGGKSTIVSLIERFYDPLAGKIMIDDWDIRDINIAHLRSSCGLVLQESSLFDLTIYENIAYGLPDETSVTQFEVEEAAKLANAHDFIVNLPQGYNTICGDKGVLLSGGQKQRIAIARAVIKKPKIILFDEATSALDPVNERIVQEAIDKASKGRTCIVIAHRLSTIQNADLILVLHGGRVAEQGTHFELLSKKKLYYEFVQNTFDINRK